MNVTIIDCSHKDRPNLTCTASKVISSKAGTAILMPRGPYCSPSHGLVTSIINLQRDIRQGFDLHLSHDWVVKVWV